MPHLPARLCKAAWPGAWGFVARGPAGSFQKLLLPGMLPRDPGTHVPNPSSSWKPSKARAWGLQSFLSELPERPPAWLSSSWMLVPGANQCSGWTKQTSSSDYQPLHTDKGTTLNSWRTFKLSMIPTPSHSLFLSLSTGNCLL